MSKHEADDEALLGYFLPEDSQHRLSKLRGHMEFLSNLAQSRKRPGDPDWFPEIAADELAVCLELLTEQATLVLAETSWPARRTQWHEPAEGDDEDAAQRLPEAAAQGFAFGVTLDQIDALERLVRTISAQGDVIATTRAADLADGTWPQLGQAILEAAAAVQSLLDQLEAQRLGDGAGPGTRVRETHAVYVVCHGAAARSRRLRRQQCRGFIGATA